MGLKGFYDRFEDIPEEYRNLFSEEEIEDPKTKAKVKRWRINAEGVADAASVERLERALSNERTESARLRTLADKIKDIDPTKYEQYQREAREADERAKRLEEETERQVADVRRELNDKHKKELETRDSTINDLRNRLHTTYLDNLLGEAIRKGEGEPRLLMHEMRSRVRIKDENGVLSHEVLGKDGKAWTVDVEGESKAATLDDLVKEYKADDVFGLAFAGSGQGGTGSTGSGGRPAGKRGSANPWKAENWNVSAQAKIAEENPALAKQMSDEAGVPLRGATKPKAKTAA